MDTIAMINHDQPRFEGKLKGFKRGKLSKDIKGEAAKRIGRRKKKKKVLSFSLPTKHIFIYTYKKKDCCRSLLSLLLAFLDDISFLFSVVRESIEATAVTAGEREIDW